MCGGYLHLRPLLGCDAWDCRVLEDASVKEFHDIEIGANDLLILAETYRPWYWDIRLL